jgi:hypothetical protein
LTPLDAAPLKETSVKSYFLILPEARFRLVSRDHKQIPDRVVRFPGILFSGLCLQSVLYASEIIRLGLSVGGGWGWKGGEVKETSDIPKRQPPPPPRFTHPPPDRNLLGSIARFGLMITTCCSLRGGKRGRGVGVGGGGIILQRVRPVQPASTEL